MDGDAVVAAASTSPLSPPQTALRHRSSVCTYVAVPANLSVSVPSTSPNGSPPAVPPDQPLDFFLTESSLAASLPRESLPPSLSYTSLRDLLPQFSSGTINSPTGASPASGRSGFEISIRNRLVKQAAWAYLRPMSASPGSAGPSFLQQLWLRLCSPVSSCLNFIGQHLIPFIAKALNRILRCLLCFSW